MITVEEINFREPADLDVELFDKLFGKGIVKTATELKGKIAEDAEKQFVQQSDQKLLNDVTEYPLDNRWELTYQLNFYINGCRLPVKKNFL